MNNVPLISVIIPVYNREKSIQRAVGSVLNQSYSDFELVIVNDGSTDATKKIIAAVDDKRVRIISSANCGVSAARNRGIISANGGYLAFLDSDDQWLPHKLKYDHDFIEQDTGYRIFQSDEIWVRNGRRVNKKKRHRKLEGDFFNDSLEQCMISPSSVVVNRDIFTEYGLFDEKMSACEDYDLWLRVTAHEGAGLIDRENIVKFGGHDDQLSRTVPVLDRLRLYSQFKLLYNENLEQKKRETLLISIMKRISILVNGAEKRGNRELVSKLTTFADLITEGAISNQISRLPDFSFLLQE